MLSLPSVDRKKYEQWSRGPFPRICRVRAALRVAFDPMARIDATSMVDGFGSVVDGARPAG